MAKRIKVPAVTADKRRNWLNRNEEGETPPTIAKSDGFDVRTVRKQIALAKQERERREARSGVLRNALEDHYNDMIKFITKLEGNLHAIDFSQAISVETLSQDRMWRSLREHIPRSTIWKRITQWEDTHQQIVVLINQGAQRIVNWLKDNGVDPEQSDISIKELTDFFKDRMQTWAHQDSVGAVKVTMEEAKDGLVNLKYDGWRMFTVPKDKVDGVKQVMERIHDYADSLSELDEIRKAQVRLRQTIDNVSEELITIKLRRVVPGECKYCPI